MTFIRVGNCQIIFWRRVWPVVSFHKWRDPYNSMVGLWFSVIIGPVEFRFWKWGRLK